MTALDHLFSCEKRLALAKQDLRAAAEKLSTAGNLAGLLAPFVVQCSERLSDTLPDDAWIMECKGQVVTAGQARALVKWWDEGESRECETGKSEPSPARCIGVPLEACAPIAWTVNALINHADHMGWGDDLLVLGRSSLGECRASLGECRAFKSAYEAAQRAANEESDAAIAAYDAVGEVNREGK